LGGCGKADDTNLRPVVIDFIYKNETNVKLEFTMRDNDSQEFNKITLLPDGLRTISNESESDRVVDPEKCCQEWLDDFQGSNANVIYINDSLYVTHDGEKSDLIENYVGFALSQNHFQYTYTFSEVDLVEAIPKPD
jgi:hypothetical protein